MAFSLVPAFTGHKAASCSFFIRDFILAGDADHALCAVALLKLLHQLPGVVIALFQVALVLQRNGLHGAPAGAGAALGAVPIVLVFLMFQKYFTQGITMGAVKG